MTKSTLENQETSPKRVLTLFDGICIIVGTIIGAGIFEIPGRVAGKLDGVAWVIGIWVVGGIVALIGALCFAELTTSYREPGGDYAYLKRGYHKRMGFAFSWAAFWIIRPGNIGSMAMIFGKFANEILGIPNGVLIYAIGIVVILSGTNLLGVTFGKTTQNILTVAKVIGILLIVAAALILPSAKETTQNANATSTVSARQSTSEKNNSDNSNKSNVAKDDAQAKNKLPQTTWSSFWLAMVFVMFAYGGWNDIAFVGAEVKNPQKNLLWALILGTLTVVVIYLLVNIALVIGLSYARFSTPFGDGSATSYLVAQKMGTWGTRFFAALVCASCAGAINGMIFTSPRIYWATAVDYPRLNWLAGQATASTKNNGWWLAMMLQMFVSIILLIMFGMTSDGFETITVSTAIYFWLFLGLTVNCVIICRWRHNSSDNIGFRIPFPFFPLLPLLFIAACLFMTYRSFDYMASEKLWIPTISIGVLMVIGVAISFLLGNPKKTADKKEES